ncbi:MAG: hypothetical protein R3E70_12970 [Burkholderiaceae bacterium]
MTNQNSKQKTAPAQMQQAQPAIDSGVVEALRQRLPQGVKVLMIDNYD